MYGGQLVVRCMFPLRHICCEHQGPDEMPLSAETSLAIAVVIVAAVAASLGIVLITKTRSPFHASIPIRFDVDTGTVQADVILASQRMRATINTSAATSMFVSTGCGSCAPPLYDPTRSGHFTTLGVSERIVYGQTASSTGAFVEDFLGLSRVFVDTPLACPTQNSKVSPAAVMIIKNFVFIAAESITPLHYPFPNQLGMAPLLAQNSSSNTSKTLNLAFPRRFFVSSILEHMYVNKLPLIWAVLLQAPGAMLWLGQGASPTCGPLVYTPLIPNLPVASTQEMRDPGRFYVVRVISMTVVSKGAATKAVPGKDTPALAIIDTASPLIQLPPGPLATELSDVRNPKGIVITLENNAQLITPSGRTPWVPKSGPPVSLFKTMSQEEALTFSRDLDVMIIGNLGLLGCVLEFDLERQHLGLAYLSRG